MIAQATGETSRFSQLLTEYIKAPEIMRKRIYIESMESVLSEANTTMINVKEGTNNMLYLPLDKMVQQTPVTNNTPPPVAEPTPKPVVEEAPAGSNRASARGRDTRGRGNVE